MYLAESIENNDFETAKILLEKDPKITTKLVDGCSPLYLASLAEQLEIVDILIKNGAKVNQRNNLSCHWDFNKSWFLSTPYIDSSLIGIKRSEVHLASPLNIACAKGNILLVEMLLKQEPDLDIQNANKNTPLSLAIINGHQEIASILLNAGADINIRAENGDPLIGQIVNKCYYGLLQEVLSFANDRINWNARNFNGHHILHHAVKQPDVEILNMILGTEAKNLINVSDKFSFAEFLEEFPEFINVERVEIPFSEIDEESQVTPIVLAIQEEAPKKIIEALVEAGADLTIKYNNRNLAYAVNDSYRDENDKNEVLNYLEKFKNQNGE
jgi:ankyrin repeat protein